LFRKTFFVGVFELPSLRNTRKCDKTKKAEGKLTSKFLSFFFEKVFGMDFLQSIVYGVFELPLPRNALKRTNKLQGGKSRLVGGWVRDPANVRGGPSIFFASPSPEKNGAGLRTGSARGVDWRCFCVSSYPAFFWGAGCACIVGWQLTEGQQRSDPLAAEIEHVPVPHRTVLGIAYWFSSFFGTNLSVGKLAFRNCQRRSNSSKASRPFFSHFSIQPFMSCFVKGSSCLWFILLSVSRQKHR
jgi:hypothetical protein